MKITVIFFIIIFLFSSLAAAHPGRTDSKGGHYCWTNCDDWGRVYGQYHYHTTSNYDSTGSIRVSSYPSGASVYLDGAYKGTSSITLNSVSTGSHTIKLIKSGYNDVSSTVTVSSGQTASVSETLTTKTGSISVHSNPSDADVSLNGIYKGTTPITLYNVPVDSHTIKLIKSGYNDVSSTVTVSSGQTASVSETLTTKTGSISVHSNPSNAGVSLDGTYKGTTPITLYNVPVGSHTIKLIKLGYNDSSSTVTISSGQTASISKTLTTKIGSISVYSNPSNAGVSLDGTYKGTTPITLYNVPVGSHTIKLIKLGYNDSSSTVTISSDRIASVSKKLIPLVDNIPLKDKTMENITVEDASVEKGFHTTPIRLLNNIRTLFINFFSL